MEASDWRLDLFVPGRPLGQTAPCTSAVGTRNYMLLRKGHAGYFRLATSSIHPRRRGRTAPCTSAVSHDNHLYAINTNGTQKWKYPTGSSIFSSPAVGHNGTVYVGSYDDYLHAINANGTEKWKYETGNEIDSSPALGPDGTVYVGSKDNNLHAINANGTKKWKYLTGGNVDSSPAVGPDGTVYVGSQDKHLHAINTNGTQKWKFLTGGVVYSPPALGPDGTVYVGSRDNNLYAINANGTQKWRFPTGGEIDSSPALGLDGTVYVGSDDNNLYAINANGTREWIFGTDGMIHSSPTVRPDGTVYVGSGDKSLHTIELRTIIQSALWRSRATSCQVGSLGRAESMDRVLVNADTCADLVSRAVCKNDVEGSLRDSFCKLFAPGENPPYSCVRQEPRPRLEALSLAFNYIEVAYFVGDFVKLMLFSWCSKRRHASTTSAVDSVHTVEPEDIRLPIIETPVGVTIEQAEVKDTETATHTATAKPAFIDTARLVTSDASTSLADIVARVQALEALVREYGHTC